MSYLTDLQITGTNNYIINGGFDYWQRSTATQTGNGYVSADRWLTENGGSTTKSFSRGAFTVGQTDVPGNPKYYASHTVTTGGAVNSYCILYSYMEDVTVLAGKTITISFYAKANASKKLALELYQRFGTGGTPSSDVSTPLGIINITTSWARYSITRTVPSISGKVLGTAGDDYCGLMIWFDGGSNYPARSSSIGTQSGVFDIAQVMVNEGAVVAPFQRAGVTLPGELTLCQRYYEKSNRLEDAPGSTLTSVSSHGAVVPTANGYACVIFPFFTKKREAGAYSTKIWDAAGTADKYSHDNWGTTRLDNLSYVSIGSQTSGVVIFAQPSATYSCWRCNWRVDCEIY